MPQGQNVNGYELTKVGMQSLFTQMGYADIGVGEMIARDVDFDASKLARQGFMPIHANSGRPPQDEGHWIMLLKGNGNHYFLFDPMGAESADHYRRALHATLPPGASLVVIPTTPGLHHGFTGYWLASAGMRAQQLLQQDDTVPLDDLANTMNMEMQTEAHQDLPNILKWLGTIADTFTDLPSTAPIDATQLRAQMERNYPHLVASF